MRAATGETRAVAPAGATGDAGSSPWRGGASLCVLAGGTCGAGALSASDRPSGDSGAAAPGSWITAMTRPTGTSSPGATVTFASTPEAGASISTVTLSV